MITSTTVWTVKSGDTLPMIAAQVYGDPRLWRPIADANGIANPLRFPGQQDFGRLLLVPAQQA
ncbi:MAG: LysM peptidoglycan-binding domain-containing protein [Candidatus Accumulibacter sp.]|uniref:LysM peptidoglycan-binding domain-containing protein n=1 Tax=Candidatus Accumulibacter affinis TaxID=2954384 RepID=A0A935T7A3_9PROT|nr:LysM peptidoglycan-binding domain-containing protein [Candidatus Accumulibacter affinis]MBP9805821.1 LysM peptidoglycan-binding domain-containing protein [Accumulibacter sp.]